MKVTNAYYVHGIVHVGHSVGTSAGVGFWLVYLACEKSPSRSPPWRLPEEMVRVDNPVDCMTCLVYEVRKNA